MSKVFLIECRSCGKPHYPVSLADALAGIKSFNDYFNTLSPEDQNKFYGGKPASIDNYLQCVRCGSVRFQQRHAAAPGVTLNPIVFEQVNQ